MKEFIEKLIGKLQDYYEECQQQSLETYKTDGNFLEYNETQGKILAIENVTEIVNQLAEEHNNDFCEWFKYDYRTIAPKNHDAENPYWRIPDNMDKLKFCPYCGKKIKVVE